MKRSRAAMIGAALGFLFFVVVGAGPVLEFAWSMARMLAGVLFGRPLVEGPLTALFIGGAMAVALIAMASLFAVAGSAIAAAAEYVVRAAQAVRRRRRG